MTGPEKAFENRIKRYLDERGIWHVKFFANAYTARGVPDILACVNGRFVAIEVKSSTGKPTALQVHTCKQITASGGIAVIVHPNSFGELCRVIDALMDGIEPDVSKIL